MSEAGRPAGRTRRLRDHVALGWLFAALVLTVVHRWVPSSSWLMVHLVLLGALSHSALVWSEHFAHTLLRSPPDEAGRRRQGVRIGLLGVGSLLVFVGVPWERWWLVVVGASLASAAVLWHAAHLVHTMRGALPNRFRVVTHYYIAAALCLPVGAGLGATLASGLSEDAHGRLLTAHMALNLLGWVGFTVTGTLVTFWPTMLRTRMDDRAEALARQALPLLACGLAVLVAGALLGWRPLALTGLAAYVGGLAWWGRALAVPLRAKGLREFAPASVLAALVWAVVGLSWVGCLLATTGEWAAVTDASLTLAAVFAVGFAAQLLSGALSYLIPSVLGGGPSVVRAGQAWFDRWALWRLVVVNAGLLLWLLPAPSWVRVTVSSLVVLALALFLPLLVQGAKASAKARRELAADGPRPAGRPAEPERRLWSGGQAIAAVTALVLALTVGVGVDPSAAGLSTAVAAPTASEVAPTGNTTRVEVVAEGMSYTPSRITVPRGDRLVVVLRNADATTAHDLLVGAARTPRLQPGETAELDAGVIGAPTRGWCSVAGHRQMGMVLDIVVEGEAPAVTPADAAGGHAGHGTAHAGAIPAVPDATLSRVVDPALAPLGEERVHRVTFTVTEVPLEVAPGLWQTRWTFNGGSVGPTLHGRVGDVFEVTLVNDGTIGHSIDFHAGALAPDRPMRTIPPGESLVYRFTATRAGIWMYHCSTMPMSTHIAAGMHGAVVIEPEGLPAVDHSYVLVQSEVFLANAAHTPEEALEVDVDKINAERPDRVVFNGVANQYDQQPFRVRVGERVRFWVLDAGPNRPSSFHVVGGQFDTSWTEGTYTLRRGEGAFGASDGGAQVLPLLPAQGGFVELTFPEPGHYPVVSHVMVDAERGAHAVVEVSR
ncbi:nitrite reductase [Propioniciclava sinopodophylli]|uniref:Copper-containing nitrite reductase n=1 Tax=Propioniciclava sinopodophylli TaxID=1837344 RepID=A0A4Q9KHD6_9ACTN|nr:multicopper oxidase domain-containing protein [Propioniciclava sinopodophylli]TBT88770.1 nitrite reductase [Propioniciclava sinopodophylli]